MLASFIPMSMLGSHGATCVTGFDQTAFVAGVSSNLWSEFNTSVCSLQPNPMAGTWIKSLLERVRRLPRSRHLKLGPLLM